MLVKSEPHWFSADQLDRSLVPQLLLTWLLDESSLTRRLVAASHGNFRVRVLSQRWQSPYVGERGRLRMRSREIALVREVELRCKGQPWVFARSVLPFRTLNGELRHLRRFGNSPLGEFLFRTSAVSREGFEICRIPAECRFVPTNLQLGEILWGRRSRFWYQGRPLLVCEVFLPGHEP